MSSPSQAPTPCCKLEPRPPTGLDARMRTVPVAVQAGVLLVLVAVGVWLGGPLGGGLLLLVAAVMLGGLALVWRKLALPERLLRLAAGFLVVAIGLVRLFPR